MNLRTALTTFLVFLLVWLAVTWNFGAANLVVGLVFCALLAWSLRGVELPDSALLILPQRVFWALLYVPVLLWHVVRANIDVAYRVLHPALPIRPGIVRARTRLQSDSARVLLANSITLTPGTLSVDLVGDTLYIHRIHLPETDPDGETERSLARFEAFIGRIFE